MLQEYAGTVQQPDERGLLPPYERLHYRSVDFGKILDLVIGCDEILPCKVFAFDSPLGPGRAALDENAAADKCRTVPDACNGSE